MHLIILKDIAAVGMHHWSHRKLERGEQLLLRREPDNPVDVNAVELLNPQTFQRLAYCARSDSIKLSNILQDPRVLNKDHVFGIVTGKWEVMIWEQGPRQTINVALEVDASVSNVFLDELKNMGIGAYRG